MTGPRGDLKLGWGLIRHSGIELDPPTQCDHYLWRPRAPGRCRRTSSTRAQLRSDPRSLSMTTSKALRRPTCAGSDT
eukprot:6255986-Pyramimonas_sp.AAC.1